VGAAVAEIGEQAEVIDAAAMWGRKSETSMRYCSALKKGSAWGEQLFFATGGGF